MDKEQVIEKIIGIGVVAIVRADNLDLALRLADACLEGGAACLEVAFTTPGAPKVIEELARTYCKGEIILGAGTVLDPETARIAILSGAQYIISPSLNPDTIRLCNRYRIASMPGAMSIREIVEAMEAGADIIKLFPGELFDPSFIKAVQSPLPQARLMPTGGVTLENAATWIKAGAVALGVGGSLTAGAKTGDYQRVTHTARAFIHAVQEARRT